MSTEIVAFNDKRPIMIVDDSPVFQIAPKAILECSMLNQAFDLRQRCHGSEQASSTRFHSAVEVIGHG
ncbi:hypothetical protein P7F88_17975 [Vibrio hannami]|uniref:hypothetical protein n=1 Tax=Vibrio hannami TaxID=2717094 RepID=UPI0024104BDA|nr:hypothetical protein [Vibrio hannami]MDG3087855.1 hypothetical protein [Vibrio hannami]